MMCVEANVQNLDKSGLNDMLRRRRNILVFENIVKKDVHKNSLAFIIFV